MQKLMLAMLAIGCSQALMGAAADKPIVLTTGEEFKQLFEVCVNHVNIIVTKPNGPDNSDFPLIWDETIGDNARRLYHMALHAPQQYQTLIQEARRRAQIFAAESSDGTAAAGANCGAIASGTASKTGGNEKDGKK